MPPKPEPIPVTAADVSRNFGVWQDRACQGPVVVTHHGRPRVVIMPVGQFEALTQGTGARRPDDLSAMRIAMLADHITGGFVAYDRDLRFTYVNNEASIHFGRSSDTLLGKTPAEANLGEPEGPVIAALRRVADGGAEVVLDVPSAIQPGRILRIHVLPYPNGVAAIFRNVAHEAQIEHEGQERAALYAARDAHGGITVARLSLRGTFEKPEAGLARIVGLPPERLQGMRLTDLLAFKDRGRVNDEIDAALSQGDTRRFLSHIIMAGGEESEACVSVAPIRESFGIAGAMIMLTISSAAGS